MTTSNKSTTAPAAKPAASQNKDPVGQAEVKPNNTDKPVGDVPKDANADTQVKHEGGSPVTAGSTENNRGEGGTIATEGNKSPTTVASQTTDNSPATGPGGHANIAAPTQDPKDGAVVKSEDVAGKTEQIDLSGDKTSATATDPEFEKALNEPDKTTISEAELDRLDRNENDGLTLEELNAKREELDRQISVASRVGEDPASTVSRQQAEHDRNELNAAMGKLVKIESVVLPTTPDSHIAWGVGGVVLTLGDIRRIARWYVKNGSKVE